MAGRKINDTPRLRMMWKEGVSNAEIAEDLGVHKHSLLKAARRMGYPARDRAGNLIPNTGTWVKPAKRAPEPVKIYRPDTRWPLAHDAAVIRTQGKWREMAALAEKINRTTAEVTARWHKLRVMQ